MKEVKLSMSNTVQIDRDAPFTKTRFALCSAPNRLGSKAATKFHGCREGFLAEVVGWFNKSVYKSKGMGQVDTKKVRLVAYRKVAKNSKRTHRDFENAIKNALRVINILERKANWSLSSVYKAKTKLDKQHLLYVFVGSPRWMKSPHFLSLYCLLVRMMSNTQFRKVKTYDDLMKVCKIVIDKNHVTDKSHIRVTHDKWLMLMKNYKTLFKGRKMAECFSPQIFGQHRTDSFGVSCEGATLLCGGKTKDSVLNKRFKDLCKKNKLKIRSYGGR